MYLGLGEIPCRPLAGFLFTAYSVAETCSYKYNKTPVKIALVVLALYTHIVFVYDYYSTMEMVCTNVKNCHVNEEKKYSFTEIIHNEDEKATSSDF
jgi:hypothetical protein